jgi:KaiC/GvpD/RAD55 family RecA-like ATPase
MHDFIAVRREAVADKLASTLLAGKDAGELVEEYQRWNSADAILSEEEGPETYVAMSMREIMETDNPDALIKVWPTALNDRLDGGLLRGHHLVVFARPEMGKTLFLVNAMVGFLKQNLRVLYIGNEEPLQMTAQRMISRITGYDKAACHMEPDAAYEKALENGYDNWVATKLTPGSIPEIERECEKWEPDVLVVDQLRNLRMREDNYVQKLEKAAAAVRQIGKKYNCLVLSATQAGDSATDKPVLDMGDVDSSNTGIPAQADVMVGISATPDDFELDRRMVSLPKNKRSGDHTSFPVKLDKTRSRIMS